MRWLVFLITCAASAEDGFIPLFNGQDLTGWHGDPDLWSVENHVIVGSTERKSVSQNTFLVYQKPFANFILRAEVLLRNGNSGIQFRSRLLDGPGWIVTGYQADFSDAGDRSAWGNFYEEKGRGRGVMRVPDEGWRIGRRVYHARGWNTYEILAQGERVQLKLNDRVTIDTKDDEASTGVIAIQLHAGPPMRVEVRNIWIKPL